MAQSEDIQNVFLEEIAPLCITSDYYVAQKGFVKIPKTGEDARKKWTSLEDKYSYLLRKNDPTREEIWTKDYIKNMVPKSQIWALGV